MKKGFSNNKLGYLITACLITVLSIFKSKATQSFNNHKFIFRTNYLIDSTNRKSKIINSVAFAATTSSYFGLYQLWYKKYPQSSFHFFNDLEEWNYMDKVGHIYSSYQISRKSHLFLKNKGINKPLEKGVIYSLTYMIGIEFLDGFSEQWGFSNYDLLSNFLGTGIYFIQEKKYEEQFIKFKFSSHQSNYAALRPSLLGSNELQSIFKDYNGQTYWITFDFNNRLQKNNKVLKYFDLSVGYSIDGFVGARNNDVSNCRNCSEIKRQSQLLLSVDLDLSTIKTKNRFLKLILNSFSIIKFPAPTLILQEQSKFKWLYF